MTDEYANQPSMSEWKFVELLSAPLHKKIVWKRSKSKVNEINLQNGVTLEFNFPDKENKLETAYSDFRNFLSAGQISTNGQYKIITEIKSTSCFEEYIVNINEKSCKIQANDTEGIRRALIFLEDRITSTGGPFLTSGKFTRKPFIKTRISRCFFGPIKREPLCRDELMDDVNYYPDEYLNRLAHEGINGLWLSIEFRDLCPSRFFPEHGKNAQKRLNKLRKTIKQCARYGIKIYIYCNEPIAFSDAYSYLLPEKHLKEHPYFAGHKENSGQFECTYFCTSSKEGKEYIEECSNYIFSNAPELGGMICITHWERPTNCYSYAHNFFNNNCPHCSKRKPWEVYHDTLTAMSKGIKKATPDAEFISWLYTPLLKTDHFGTEQEKMEVFNQIAAHTPKDVIMQMNFESNGKVEQLGREFTAYDYWLSYPGPSEFFSTCASNIVKSGARASAKIQVGCSHENATIPFMPTPGSLYRKYHAMKKLGVSAVMQCWYFGNYPGLMNKAAGELSFLPFPKNENEFLEKLAAIDWAENYKEVKTAWQYFMKAYSNFPISLTFAHFGPLHCSIVWPLHLYPADLPIAPSWEFGYSDSGDRIGECIGFGHSLDEILKLLAKMDEIWQKGVAIFTELENNYTENIDRQMDIGLCKAIGLQIKSTRNIFTFYDIREKLPFMEKREQLGAMKKMGKIVFNEIENSKNMKQLCLKDPRLGFHSEAEGYKFFPAKLDWRIGLLEKLIQEDFPKLLGDIKKEKLVFGEYTGVSPKGKFYSCNKNAKEAQYENFDDNSGSWKAWNDSRKLHFEVKWNPKNNENEMIKIDIEPRRLWPVFRLEMSSDGRQSHYSPSAQEKIKWTGAMNKTGKEIVSTFSIPFSSIPYFDEKKPLRINVYQHDSAHNYICGWVKQNPLKARAFFGTHNSANLGWLFIK